MSNNLPIPITKEERYLAYIAGNKDVEVPKSPINRKERYLDRWAFNSDIEIVESSGNPVQCTPMAGMNMKIAASWEPKQEGSGEPYPAGGGKNLLDISKCTPASKNSAYGLTVSVNGDVVSLSGTPNVTADSPRAVFRILFSTQTISVDYNAKVFVTKGTVTRVTTIQSDKSIVIEAPLSPNTPVSIEMRIMFYVGDEPTAYAPYENIRPITGYDSVTVQRCGRQIIPANLSKLDLESNTKNLIKNIQIQDDEIVFWAENNSTGYFLINKKIPVSNKIYLGFSATVENADESFFQRFIFKCFDINGNLLTNNSCIVAPKYISFNQYYEAFYWDSSKTTLFSFSNEVSYIKLGICVVTKTNDFKKTVRIKNISATYDKPTTYIPYTGQTNVLTLPSTIYGGSVDAVTGEGQETWKFLTLDGTENWIKGVNEGAIRTYFEYSVSEKNTNIPISGSNINAAKTVQLCSHLAVNNPYSYDVDNCFWVYFIPRSETPTLRIRSTSNFTTVVELKSYLAAQYAAGTPVQIAYKLANPVPFKATGGQPIKALPGINNIITDADSVSVKYKKMREV